MISLPSLVTSRPVRGLYVFGPIVLLLMVLYFGLLYIFGAVAAAGAVLLLSRKKQAGWIATVGGLAGVAGWMMVIVHFRDYYLQFAEFLKRHSGWSANACYLTTDALICGGTAVLLTLLIDALLKVAERGRPA